jgi:4-alpha-glucanotransferase
MAGVPPDYFSATGQLWGNPIYRWDRMEQDGFAWWIERFRASFGDFDCVRLDHFRGFQAYWEVPDGETTAMHGEWKEGPGGRLLEAVTKALGPLPIVAENLGVITPAVEAIRERFRLPGMAILQFAFGTDPQAPSFRPHNYPRSIVAYTGTHDNDTAMGWWQSAGGDSTRTAADVEKEKRFACEYLATDGREIHWDMIRALEASVADTVIVPVQDLLGLGSEARMNMPSTLGGNWLWRLQPGRLSSAAAARLRRMAECYGRLP